MRHGVACRCRGKKQLDKDVRWAALREEFVCLDWNRDWSPEVDQALQSFAQHRASQSGWPLNIFLSPEGELLFICSALETDSFVSLARQLWVAWQTDPESVRSQAQNELQKFREQDPLSLEKENELPQNWHENLDRASLYRFLTPLEQSLSVDAGWIGSGQIYHFPYVYRALLSFEDLSKWADLALVNLARSPLCDVVGGGFFRSLTLDERKWADKPIGEKDFSAIQNVSTEKSLLENAELLEAYVEAHQLKPQPFLNQVAHELIETILNDFLILPADENLEEASLSSALSDSKEFYEWSASDLIAALSPKERQAAQLFFGIQQGRVPYIQSEVSVLAQFVGVEALDLRLQLLSSRKNMKEFRSDREVPHPARIPPERNAEITAWRALAWAAFVFDTPQATPLCEGLYQRYSEEYELQSHTWSAREKGAYLRALAAMTRLYTAQKEKDKAKECFEKAESLIFALKDPLITEAIWDSPFLGERIDLCDHTGPSGLANLIAGMLDYNSLQKMGLRGKYNLPLDVGYPLAWALEKARPLGLHAASLYWCLMRYQKQQSVAGTA
jgi:uncharacterized protein YyaL (SSP411 family)